MHFYSSLQLFQLFTPDHIFSFQASAFIPLFYPNLVYLISDPTWHAKHHHEAMHCACPRCTFKTIGRAKGARAGFNPSISREKSGTASHSARFAFMACSRADVLLEAIRAGFLKVFFFFFLVNDNQSSIKQATSHWYSS